jgi:membrane protease YdiL (CAAX protease family)
MSKLIPERPLYQKERLIVGYPTLAVFSLLFLVRMLGSYVFDVKGSLLLKLGSLLVVFLLPTVIFLLMRGQGYGRVLRLRATRVSHIPFLIAAFLALLCGCILLSLLCGGIDSLGNSATTYETASPTTPLYGICMTVVLAIFPALLEEFFFRGIVVAEYERRGGIRAVLMSALLFSLCHFDLRNFPVYLFSGVLLVLVLFATDSLLATALLHVLYNVVSLFGQRYLNALYEITGSIELFLFLLIFVFLLSLLLLFRSGALLYRARVQSGQGDPRRDVPWNVQFYTILDALSDPPVVLCILISIAGFIFL